MAGMDDTSLDSGLGRVRLQFGLRSLMLAITLCGILFAAMSALGALWSATLILFLSLAAAHVVGNALGTQLRDAGSRQPGPVEPAVPFDAARPPVPTAQRLRERTGVSRGMLVIAAIGGLAGGTLGGVALAATLGEQASLAAFALGVVSSAVLGGFFAFLSSSFCFVFSRALGEALGDPAVRPYYARPTLEVESAFRTLLAFQSPRPLSGSRGIL